MTAAWSFAGPIIEAEMSRNRVILVPGLKAANGGNQARMRSAVALVMNDHLL